jgi:3-oxoacyl-[acyl-carrier protein] reductase
VKVLVTGASGGIGRALADVFADSGADLVLAAHRNRAALDAFVAGRPWRARAVTVEVDVTRPATLVAPLAGVDVCIANAGIGPPEEVPLHEMSETRIRSVVEVNLVGALFTARAFLAELARAGARPAGASLVFIGSTAGRFGEAGHAEYAAAKAALTGLMLSLKNEIVRLDPRGRVNLVEPGWTRTSMVDLEVEAGAIERTLATMPLKRLAEPEDVARAVLWLASPDARHVTGQVLTVAGGMEGRVVPA